ncbi:murein biosynthesis integral membrane protein MurJ [Metallumcola ferriviriculae]|uniref:Probable lipid II flippase MurJ n=1 Tax=Metallumcola ferriviriculae TaxID=3039180 RepID=A0AAU0UK71_9FIRM|nr:murein biosynthesis integral membrane protein MurJ [Desulfitibacteraceae bacterium MK1]
MNVSGKMTRNTFLILILTLLSRILGLGRETAIAYRFGTTGTADAFLIAFTIPFIFYSAVGRTLSTVIIPVYSEYVALGQRVASWKLLSKVINLVFLITTASTVVAIINAATLANFFGAGFNTEVLGIATILISLIMPSIIFMTLSGLLGGILNANNVFGPPAVGPAIMNITIILFAMFSTMWLGVYGLVIGTVVGSLFFLLVQLVALKGIGFKYFISFDFKDPALYKIMLAILPILIVSGITQLYTLIDFRFASALSEGSIAALNYARKTMQLPQSLFITAVTTAIYPTLSRLATEAKSKEMITSLRTGLKSILLMAIPGAIGMVVLRQPIVTLLFERGAFDPRATSMTADALFFYSFGIVGLCFYIPLTRAFFAMKDVRTPLLVVVTTLGLKISLNILLVPSLGHSALALTTTLTLFTTAIILSVFFQQRMGGLFDGVFFRFIGATIASGVAMGYVVYLVDTFLAAKLGFGLLLLATRLGIDVGVGALTFGIIGFGLRIYETRHLLHLLSIFRLGRLHKRINALATEQTIPEKGGTTLD